MPIQDILLPQIPYIGQVVLYLLLVNYVILDLGLPSVVNIVGWTVS